MNNTNKFIGIGRNTKDGEYRTSETGVSMYSNSIAMTNNFKNKDGNYDSEFLDYTAYRTTADYLNKYAKKGTQIAIEGRIQTTSSEKDGHKRYFTKVIVENASVLEKNDRQEEPKQEETQENIQEVPESYTTEYDTSKSDIQLSDNDLPF